MTRSDAELYAPAACCCGCISRTREDFIKFRTERDDTGYYFVSAFEAASTALTKSGKPPCAQASIFNCLIKAAVIANHDVASAQGNFGSESANRPQPLERLLLGVNRSNRGGASVIGCFLDYFRGSGWRTVLAKNGPDNS